MQIHQINPRPTIHIDNELHVYINDAFPVNSKRTDKNLFIASLDLGFAIVLIVDPFEMLYTPFFSALRLSHVIM